MTFNSLTLALQNFIAAFSGGYARLQGAANSLLAILVAIEVVLLGLWAALGGGDTLVPIFKKILHIGAWVFVVHSFPSIAKAFRDSVVQAGFTAGGGGDVSLMLDPSRIAGYGLDATKPLADKLGDVSWMHIGDKLVYFIGYAVILGSFLIMAIHVFLAVCEYYIFAALAGIFIPFGVFGPTKFLAEKAIGAVVSASIKLMVLAFVLAVVDPVLASIHFAGPDITVNELCSVLLTVCALAMLCWKAPALASALLGGSPSLGAADVVGAAAGAAAGAFAAAPAGRVAMQAAQAVGRALGVTGQKGEPGPSSPGGGGPSGGPGGGAKGGGSSGGEAGKSSPSSRGASSALVQSVMGKGGAGGAS